jgi:hypothetical protein
MFSLLDREDALKRVWKRGRYQEVIIPLEDITHLFVVPDFDPYSDRATYASGLDTILTALRSKSLRKKTRAILVLPTQVITEGLESTVKQAVIRYCDFKIQEAKSELAATLWQGTKALQSGVVFLVVCLALAALVDASTLIPRILGNFLSEGLTIVGWVSLWRPVELLLYEWWPLWRNRRVYEYIGKMDLVIQAQA